MENQISNNNKTSIDIETEKKIIKAKETMLLNKTLSDDKRIGLFDKSIKDVIIHTLIWFSLLLIGFLFSAIFYNVSDSIILNNLSIDVHIVVCLPFAFGLLQIFFTFWSKYKGFLFRFLGIGILTSQIIFIFRSINCILIKEFSYNTFTQIIQNKNIVIELYTYLIVLLSIYLILLLINITLNIKTIISELL